jgi:uncharacterized protein YecE (DUF72 family)
VALCRIGTSGWQYDEWRGAFYPAEIARARWLEHYASRFATVEVNNAFYRLPETRTFASWRERTPEDFQVALKASRFLTHVKRLRDPEEPVARLLERCRALQDKLGPILLQLPPTLPADLGALAATLAAFPPDIRVAVEARHESWFSPATEQLLAEHGAAYCLSDTVGGRAPRWCTAEFAYLRFHGGTGRPRPCYRPSALAKWAEWLAGALGRDAEAFVYFNNDGAGCAPRDAVRFAAAAQRVGLAITRTPAPSDVPLVGRRAR